MQIILLENIKSLGEFGQIVNVKSGYARNYLLPQGKAIYASKQAQADFNERRQEYLARAQEVRLQIQAQAEAVEGLELIISARTVDGIKLYGSVTEHDIVAAAAEQGKEIKASAVVMADGHIRTTGEFAIPIDFGNDISATINLTIQDIQNNDG